jgi:hypothetical protein
MIALTRHLPRRSHGVIQGLATWIASIVLLGVLPWAAAAQVQINELRVDQPGTDNDEYFELKGPPLTPLAGHTLIVIGDATGTSCGTIEAVVGLGPFAIQADGFFAGAEPTITLAGIDHVFAANALNFENTDNVTYLLVTGFSGAPGMDVDTNDDGVLDVTPWTAIVDGIGLVGGAVIDCATVEYVYAATTVGPDGAVPPFAAFRCGDSGDWHVADATLGVDDSPGAANRSCAAPAPDILDETRVPCVPTTGAAATAVVKVRLAAGADLHWRVNGGVETVTPMTVAATSGDTTWFQGVIPGQPANGDRVQYHVTTTNPNGTDQGFDQGYFVGTTPIGSLRVHDANGLNVYRFHGARVRGNVTLAPGIFSPTDMDFYIQDATGGINVFQFGPHPEQPQLGDDVTVTATISQYNGKLEITPDGPCDQLDILVHGPGTPPAPMLVDACTPPESYEGVLVRMRRLTLHTGGEATWAGNRSYRGTNCTPVDSATVFIDVDTNIDGTPIATFLDVVGIGSQYDTTFPLTAYHEVIPRSLADLAPLDPLGVGNDGREAGLWLGPVVPHPAGSIAELRYHLPGTHEARVRIEVIDVQGRSIATLFEGTQSPGEHRLTLAREALRDASGAVRFLLLQVGDRSVTRKLIHR